MLNVASLKSYDLPVGGLYMEPDPIGLEGGLNPYAYAGNNPVMNVDPSGLDFTMLDDWSLSQVSMPSSLNINLDMSGGSSGVFSTMQRLSDRQMSDIDGQGGVLNLFGKDTDMYAKASHTQANPKYNIIQAHGGPNQFWLGALYNEAGKPGNSVSPKELYNLVLNDPSYDKAQPTLFGACALAGGYCQEYANISGQTAYCYDKYVWYGSHGMQGSWAPKDVYGKIKDLSKPGTLYRYTPQGK